VSGSTPEAALAAAREGELEDRCAAVAALAAMPGETATRALVTLLEDASWFLRERVVAALVERPDALELVLDVLQGGAWYAKASACDVLAGLEERRALPVLIVQLGERNVSVQKSAARAIERLASRWGDDAVASEVARLASAERRRVLARLGHQSPAWKGRLEVELARLPAEVFVAEVEEVPVARKGAAERGGRTDEVEELRRFRRWLARLPVAGG
jgi:HEAT repeat protein